MVIQWYPGHMNKTLKTMEKDIKIVDAIVYVLDSRAPFACLNPKFSMLIGDKPIIYILNKSDLGDEKKIQEWCNYLNSGKNVCLTLNSTASGASSKLENAIKKDASITLTAKHFLNISEKNCCDFCEPKSSTAEICQALIKNPITVIIIVGIL